MFNPTKKNKKETQYVMLEHRFSIYVFYSEAWSKEVKFYYGFSVC